MFAFWRRRKSLSVWCACVVDKIASLPPHHPSPSLSCLFLCVRARVHMPLNGAAFVEKRMARNRSREKINRLLFFLCVFVCEPLLIRPPPPSPTPTPPFHPSRGSNCILLLLSLYTPSLLHFVSTSPPLRSHIARHGEEFCSPRLSSRPPRVEDKARCNAEPHSASHQRVCMVRRSAHFSHRDTSL